ncbi:site-specific DNA-methyltransferase [Arsenicicoccus bolidensis]|uniref:site-specific DNA-methyltransferase n=1 Tax=Arsenicicoccus bolidensis TaxID=229480 RepID=UPI0004210B50|nr:DNA methyltransferase [Arsenicicoccus bolidensis]
MANELNDILARVSALDSATGEELRRQIESLRNRRANGLNFERHRPEQVSLVGRPISVGDKVRFIPPRGESKAESDVTWIVTKITGTKGCKVAELLNPAGGATAERPLDDLVFVADFRDPIYPGLISAGKVARADGAPFHTVINSENYHALEALLVTHQGKVDVVYIDPPYGTGAKDWKYNDAWVDGTDAYRHSKWLSFMERRLKLAKKLLRDTGVIIVAIGDDQHHRLRMLLDQTFGEQNFISDVVWQGSGKNDARFTAGGVDYMLIYGLNVALMADKDIRWSETKGGVELLRGLAAQAWVESGHDAAQATKLFRKLVRPHRSELEPAVYRYDQIDEQGRVFQADNLTSPNPRENLSYPLTHPVTGKPIPFPDKGWRYSRETMDRLIAEGRVLFGPDETTRPRFKRMLDDMESRVPYETFTQSRMPASNYLKKILGDKRFPFPKDHTVLMRWLRLVASDNAVVLDFFGGSGSTMEAVMRLNAEDAGTRQCILVTNNELSAAEEAKLRRGGHRPGDSEWESLGVYEHVTRPRIETVATGVRPDGSVFDTDGLPTNVEFFTLTYLNPKLVELDLAFKSIAPHLWMRAGSQGRRIDERSDTFDVADTYAVLFNVDASGPFLKAVDQAAGLRTVFVVTNDEPQFQAIASQLPEGLEAVRLYESYLRTFEINSERA